MLSTINGITVNTVINRNVRRNILLFKMSDIKPYVFYLVHNKYIPFDLIMSYVNIRLAYNYSNL